MISSVYLENWFITIYILAALVVGAWVAWQSGDKMSVISSGVPEVDFTFTSGQSESMFPIRIENTTQKIIQPSSLEIEITSSEGVEFDVENVRKVNDNIWQPYLPIQQDSGLTVELTLTRADSATEISGEKLFIEIRRDNDMEASHEVNLRG